MQELEEKQMMKECEFCKERDFKLKNYEEEIEKEKIAQCLVALEREKIAKGMQCTKMDEIKLKEMQKMQMREKKQIEEEAEQMERMWHRVLVDTVNMKEEYERQEAERLKQEMTERRLFYDEQIASANRKRREAIKHEREVENRRLERMKKKMEEDYHEAIKRKKDQQQKNKKNFIEGHEIKLSRIRNEKNTERELDNKTIRVAMEEVRKERERMKNQMKSLRIEKEVFVESVNQERKMANTLVKETDKFIEEWMQRGQRETEEKIKSAEVQKIEIKKNAAQEYRRHIEERQKEIEREKLERLDRMARVKETAYAELKRNMESANEELRRQIQYRNTLTNQIKENQKIIETELTSIENKQRPFTKKAIMFKDAMKDKINNARVSTNPVHPFRRTIQSQSSVSDSKIVLPNIDK